MKSLGCSKRKLSKTISTCSLSHTRNRRALLAEYRQPTSTSPISDFEVSLASTSATRGIAGDRLLAGADAVRRAVALLLLWRCPVQLHELRVIQAARLLPRRRPGRRLRVGVTHKVHLSRRSS